MDEEQPRMICLLSSASVAVPNFSSQFLEFKDHVARLSGFIRYARLLSYFILMLLYWQFLDKEFLIALS